MAKVNLISGKFFQVTETFRTLHWFRQLYVKEKLGENMYIDAGAQLNANCNVSY